MKKILLVISSFLISLFISEIILRILFPTTTLNYYQNPLIGSALVPNQKGLFVTPTTEYKTEVSVNSHGWPDVGHSYEKPQGTFRIVILGDSFVENWQVPLEQRFFRQLQKSLGDKYEIIALGRGNTGTYQQNLILKNYGLKYQPDLVIHMFLTANDIKDNSPILNPTLYQTKVDSKFKSYLKKIRLVNFILAIRQKNRENKFNSKIDYPIDYHVYDQNYTKDYQDAWNKTKELILDTKNISEETGAKYILMTLANNEQLNKNVVSEIYKKYPKAKEASLDLEKPDKLIKEFAENNKLELFQMLPHYLDFVNQNPNTVIHYFYDGHWTKDGSDLGAKLLFNYIVSQN